MVGYRQQRLDARALENTERGDRLVASMSRGYSDRGAHELLAAFFQGYPVDRLRALLASPEEATARTAAWILSELGFAAAPLRDTFEGLLNHPARYVRFHALDAVLTCATPQDEVLLAKTVGLLHDHDDAVRWKALGFIAHASTGQLVGSTGQQSDPQLARLTRWLVDLDTGSGAGDRIIQALASTEPVERKFAVAGACRIDLNDPHPFTYALQSHHAEIASFAAEQARSHPVAGLAKKP